MNDRRTPQPQRRAAGRRRPLTVLTVAVVVLALGSIGVAGAQDADGRYRDFGEPQSQTFWNIVPPGQDGVLNGPEAAQGAAGGGTPEHFDDQLLVYESLIFEDATPGFAEADLPDYFKDASFGVPDDDVDRVYSPGGRDDVTVIRDASFGVPHIFGDTREGTMFAQGYTAAEDRLFLMDALRHVGRAELAAWLGASGGNLAQDAEQLAVAPYVEQDFTDQIEAIRDSGPNGAKAYDDVVAYTAGVNQYIQEAIADPSKLPAEYPALQLVPETWRLEDAVAIASLVGGIFGKSGGGEVHNLCALEQLEAAFPGQGRRILDEFSFYDDAESVTTATTTFTYPPEAPVDPASIPDIDCDSLAPIEAPALSPEDAALLPGAIQDLIPDPVLPDGPEDLPIGAADAAAGGDLLAALQGDTKPFDFNTAMSNAVVVGADATDTGHPIAVFGPQTGYFAPQLLVEKDVHGPGIDARGVSFAGTDLWVQLGRGVDYAWSATSSHVDNVDAVVLRLCDPDGGEATVDSMGYEHDGECKEIEAHDRLFIAKPGAGGDPTGLSGIDPSDPSELERLPDLIANLGPDDVLVRKYFERAPDYGPIGQRGTTKDGTPIAVATYRTTYGDELGSAIGFMLLNDPTVVTDVQSWRENFSDNVDYVFNWFYADAEDIGYDVSCRCQVRGAGTDFYLPYWGDGNWDPQGFLPRTDLPEETNPDSGYLVSWNNKEAPGFRSSDSSRAFGPVHRSSLLERRLLDTMAEGPVDVGEAVDVAALASTTDLRGQEVMPLLERVMGDTAPSRLDDRTQAMWDALIDWAHDDLGHRRDHDDDGSYEHALAVAVMDAWWGHVPHHEDTARLTDAMFLEGHPINVRSTVGVKVMDGNLRGHIGSAFQDDLSSHVNKDLRQLLGDDVADPWSTTWCGNGVLATCAERLWESLSDTAAALEEEFGSDDPADWARVISDDDIRHSTVGVVGVAAINWQNRPTFQQVVQFGAADDGGGGTGAGSGSGPSMPATGGGVLASLVGALILAGLVGRRRRR